MRYGMNFVFLCKCFLIGVLASSTVGPIFVITFNRAALHGFWKGFASALGSSLVDGIYFALGLLGAFKLLENSRQVTIVMDGFAGIILIVLGVMSLKDISRNLEKSIPHDANFFLTGAKTFILTIMNPFVVLFFMTLSVQILPEGVTRLPLCDVLQASFMISCGSLTILSCLSLIASIIGSTIKRKYLVMVEYSTGLVFIGSGIYFIIHLLKSLIYW